MSADATYMTLEMETVEIKVQKMLASSPNAPVDPNESVDPEYVESPELFEILMFIGE